MLRIINTVAVAGWKQQQRNEGPLRLQQLYTYRKVRVLDVVSAGNAIVEGVIVVDVCRRLSASVGVRLRLQPSWCEMNNEAQ